MGAKWTVHMREASTRLFSLGANGSVLPCFVHDAAGRLIWDPSPRTALQSETANLVIDGAAGLDPLSALLQRILVALPASRKRQYEAAYPNLHPLRRPWVWCSIPPSQPAMDKVQPLCAAIDKGSLSEGEASMVRAALMNSGVCEIPQGDRFLADYHVIGEKSQGFPFDTLKVVQPGWLVRGVIQRKAVLGRISI
jgi:hypothetical protein